MKFEAVPAVFDRQIWKWRQSGGMAMVEFLSPAFGDEGVNPLPALGVSAQTLTHRNFLIAQPQMIVCDNGSRSWVILRMPTGYRRRLNYI